MSRMTIQVPGEIKASIEDLKKQFGAKTDYETIDKLIAYQARNQNHLDMADEVRDEFKAVKTYLGIREDSQLLLLLLSHYNFADSFKRETFELYRNLR